MSTASELVLTSDLRDRLGRWTRIVRLFATRDERRYRIDPDEYLELYDGLLELCRTASDSERAADSAPCEEIRKLVAPWIGLDSLSRADREITAGLLAQCRSIRQVLDKQSRPRAHWRIARLLLMGLGCVAAVALGMRLVAMLGPSLWSAAAATITRWSEPVFLTIGLASREQQLLLSGALVLASTMALVWRAGRRS